MKKGKEKKTILSIVITIIQIAVFPLILMCYGWYLGQLHQSMVDLAGIIMFMTGVLGLVIAIIISFLMRKLSWSRRWYVRVIEGLAGCLIVFIGIVIYARWHG